MLADGISFQLQAYAGCALPCAAEINAAPAPEVLVIPFCALGSATSYHCRCRWQLRAFVCYYYLAIHRPGWLDSIGSQHALLMQHGILSCLSIAILYVAPFYLWRTKLPRNHPKTIIRRMQSVVAVSCVAWLPLYILRRSKVNPLLIMHSKCCHSHHLCVSSEACQVQDRYGPQWKWQ